MTDVRREVILDEDIAALITQARTQRFARKLTRRVVSHASGLTERAIYKIETLTVNPSVETFMRYAASVGLRLTLTQEDQP